MKYLDKKLVEELNRLDSEEEIRQANAILKDRYSQLQSKAVSQFHISQDVFFISKYGRRIDGKIDKINRKTIIVFSGDGKGWKVSPNRLTPNTGD